MTSDHHIPFNVSCCRYVLSKKETLHTHSRRVLCNLKTAYTCMLITEPSCAKVMLYFTHVERVQLSSQAPFLLLQSATETAQRWADLCSRPLTIIKNPNSAVFSLHEMIVHCWVFSCLSISNLLESWLLAWICLICLV